jgi:hypothetical protein
MTPIKAIAIEDQYFQMLTLILVAVGIGLEVYQWIHEPRDWYWTLSTLLWMFHLSFFYILLTIDRYTTLKISVPFGSYTMWSSILRLHIVSTIVVTEFFRVRQKNLRKKKKELDNELLIIKSVETVKKHVLEEQEMFENPKKGE